MKANSKQYARALLESLEKRSGKEKEIVERFFSLLVSDGKISLVDDVIESFKRQWNNKNGVIDAEFVFSHYPSEKTMKTIKKVVAGLSKAKKIGYVESVDKDILGGMVLRYGDKVLDLSLKNRLEELKADLSD